MTAAPRRAVHRGRILERHSLADARARVDVQVDLFPRSGRVLRNLAGIPLLLCGSDVLALGVVVAVFGIGRLVLAFAVLVLLARTAMRYYRRRLLPSVLDDVPRAIGSTVAGVGLTLAAVYVVRGNSQSSGVVVQRALLFLAVGLVLQTLAFDGVRRVRRRRRGRNTLVVGDGRVAAAVSAALLDHPELGLTPVGIAGPSAASPWSADRTVPVLTHDMDSLPRVILDHDIDTAILALDDRATEHVDTVISVHQTGCELFVVPPMFELHHDGTDVERVRGIPLLRLRPDPTLRPSWWIKRFVDHAVGVLGLLVLAVPLSVVAVLILVDTGRPVLFWQERVGLDGRIFRLCKFRSMLPTSEAESRTTWNIASDARVSRLGHALRRTSVDEIPQLWNIARGQMSLVGPRPERPSFVRKFTDEHDRYWARHRVPVGLTGLAQVNGLRGDTSITERARFDNYYIANWSLWLDIKVMLLTVHEVLGGRGR